MATPEYLITWPKLLYVYANRLDPTRQITAKARVFWFYEPSAHETNEKRIILTNAVIARVDGRSMYFYQDLIFCRSGFFYLFDLENFRGAIFVIGDCFHGDILSYLPLRQRKRMVS